MSVSTEPPTVRECIMCGKPLQVRRGNAKTCSSLCRKHLYDARHNRMKHVKVFTDTDGVEHVEMDSKALRREERQAADHQVGHTSDKLYAVRTYVSSLCDMLERMPPAQRPKLIKRYESFLVTELRFTIRNLNRLQAIIDSALEGGDKQ